MLGTASRTALVAAFALVGALPAAKDEAWAQDGARFTLWNWDIDASATYGRNEFAYGVQNSLNASLGPSSPTSFRSGAFVFEQLSGNLDVVLTGRSLGEER